MFPIVYSPSLNQSYAVKVLSGTALPTFPESRRRICSASWKVEPSGKALDVAALIAIQAFAKTAPKPNGLAQIDAAIRFAKSGKASWMRQPVVVLGSRLDESARRALSMKKHGQRPDAITTEDDGRRTISPIASWSELDVWEMIGLAGVKGGVYPVWQDDFSELVTLYRGAAGGCVIVPGKRAAAKACGARFGCHACQAVPIDESGKALTEEPRWEYSAPLLHIRDFIANIRHDFSRRAWLDCTEDPAGFIKVFPGPIAGETARAIIRYYMTADRNEAVRADRFRRAVAAGVMPNDPYVRDCLAKGRQPDAGYMARMQRPQFRIFHPRNVIACDIYATLRGHQAESFGVLRAWHDVWHLGHSFYPPTIAPTKPQSLPAPRWIPVENAPCTWGHDIVASAITELCPWEHDRDPDGWPMMPQNGGDEFDVDEEAAWLIVEEEYPHHLRKSYLDSYKGPFASVHYYMNIGCLIFTAQGKASLMRRIQRLERWAALGLVEKSRDELLARSISHEEYIARGGTMTTPGQAQMSLL